jgi:hypothetical protein
MDQLYTALYGSMTKHTYISQTTKIYLAGRTKILIDCGKYKIHLIF